MPAGDSFFLRKGLTGARHWPLEVLCSVVFVLRPQVPVRSVVQALSKLHVFDEDLVQAGMPSGLHCGKLMKSMTCLIPTLIHWSCNRESFHGVWCSFLGSWRLLQWPKKQVCDDAIHESALRAKFKTLWSLARWFQTHASSAGEKGKPLASGFCLWTAKAQALELKRCSWKLETWRNV